MMFENREEEFDYSFVGLLGQIRTIYIYIDTTIYGLINNEFFQIQINHGQSSS